MQKSRVLGNKSEKVRGRARKIHTSLPVFCFDLALLIWIFRALLSLYPSLFCSYFLVLSFFALYCTPIYTFYALYSFCPSLLLFPSLSSVFLLFASRVKSAWRCRGAVFSRLPFKLSASARWFLPDDGVDAENLYFILIHSSTASNHFFFSSIEMLLKENFLLLHFCFVRSNKYTWPLYHMVPYFSVIAAMAG